ncbi:MAG: hypothetical protein UW02_C0006G0002 [Candidatus Nomurabacteria bacterium GW2011_GWB1_43_7]|uniref:Secreted protein n=1 Tax=Candidatus Nomurabacteria bacterium GW2011_GWB1_43_7 TaxID=1618747 RepID=A0A0G1FBF6_9BACT|nr:MAG: hypothetical protein UW02_C0006G0002 [Candidatus Nomurabacteria bacterium GW2011_GWB1_43_7]
MSKKIKLSVGSVLILSAVALSGFFTFATLASAASDVTCNSATLSGWVDPQGVPTGCHLQQRHTKRLGRSPRGPDHRLDAVGYFFQSFWGNFFFHSPSSLRI